MKTTINNQKFIIVDLFSGSYNINNFGHELFNDIQNSITGKYHGYVPDKDNPKIDNLGADRKASYIDDILIVFVKKISATNSNRIITGIYPNARVYRKCISGDNLNRQFKDKDGSTKTATYSIESNEYIEIKRSESLIIEIKDYNPWMFRKQRVYSGKYPGLDIKIWNFIDKLHNRNEIDDDFDFQEIVNQIDIDADSYNNKSAMREVEYEETTKGKAVKKNARFSKIAIHNANYMCQFDSEHITFITTRNTPYMEGHHLIPCTVKNASLISDNFNRNLDCIENIVSLCPTCHRAIHYGNKKDKSEMLARLFELQNKKLRSIGINISLDDLFFFYNVQNSCN